MRFVTSFAVALACASVIAVQAQDTKVKSKTKIEGGDVQTLTYTGCLQTGTEARTYVLDKVIPVSRTTERQPTGTGGTIQTTTTTYLLVPGEKVELQTHVGHKVQVTGLLIPAGDMKTRSKTKIEREDAKDTTIKEKSKIDADRPQLRVVSIKDLPDPC
jgi:hypothetical protein